MTGGVVYIEENGVFRPIWVDEKFVADRMAVERMTEPTTTWVEPKTIFGITEVPETEEPDWVYW